MENLQNDHQLKQYSQQNVLFEPYRLEINIIFIIACQFSIWDIKHKKQATFHLKFTSMFT